MNVILYRTMCVDLLLFSSTFIFMPLASKCAQKMNSKLPNIVMGSIFWGLLIIGYLLFIYINSIRILDREIKYRRKKVPGIFLFGCGKVATIVDVLGAVSIAIFILCVLYGNEKCLYVSISLMVFLLQMHSFVNGNNYRYIQEIKKGE